MNQSPIVNQNQLNQCLVFMTLSSGLVWGEVVVVEERFWTLAIVRASLRDTSRCNSYLGLQGGANVFIGGCGRLMKQVEEGFSLHLELLLHVVVHICLILCLMAEDSSIHDPDSGAQKVTPHYVSTGER